MFKTKVRFSKSKKYGNARRNKALLAKLGTSLADSIRSRVVNKLRDGHGKRLAPLDDEYASSKRERGKRPVRDGLLSGAMWDALTVAIGRSRKGDTIKLYFRGSQAVDRGDQRTRVPNRTKAAGLQYNDGGRDVWLLSLTQAEIDRATEWLRKHLHLL